MTIFINTAAALLLLMTAVVTLLHKIVEYKSARMKYKAEHPAPPAATKTASRNRVKLDRVMFPWYVWCNLLMFMSLTPLVYMMLGSRHENPARMYDIGQAGIWVALYVVSAASARDANIFYISDK